MGIYERLLYKACKLKDTGRWCNQTIGKKKSLWKCICTELGGSRVGLEFGNVSWMVTHQESLAELLSSQPGSIGAHAMGKGSAWNMIYHLFISCPLMEWGKTRNNKSTQNCFLKFTLQCFTIVLSVQGISFCSKCSPINQLEILASIFLSN